MRYPKYSRAHRLFAWASLFSLAPCAIAPSAGRAGEVSDLSGAFIQFLRFPTHGRLTFRIDPSIPVEWHDTPSGFSAFFKGTTLVDFGAPFGDEERWAASFARLSDPRIASIRFREVSGGVRVEGLWKFPKGPNAPAELRMETFNFRESAPPRFVVDFWVKPGLTLAELRVRQLADAKKKAERSDHQRLQQRSDRRIASVKAQEEMDDLTRFCREPLKDGRDIFLPFLAVHEPFDFTRYLPTSSPDQDYEYFRPKGEERDAQYVRLALDLYRDGKYALVNRTLDFLDGEFPQSGYRKEMNFLRANALLKLGMKVEGERMLEEVRLDARGTPPALHAALYLASEALQKDSPLVTEEAFSWLVQNYPDNRLSWMFHLAIAEALYQIEQTERAVKEYEWVVGHAADENQRAMAAFRIGDLYLNRRQYEEALGAYVRATRLFPKQATANAAIHLNRAEALTGLEAYDDARAELVKYMADFPSYPQGWRAALRLGEIAARKDGDEARRESRRWYYETINRFPFSPGSTLARIRLLPCDDHGGFNAEAANRFFATEARTFDSPGDLVMTKYGDLRAQARVRSLVAFAQDSVSQPAEAGVAMRAYKDSVSQPAEAGVATHIYEEAAAAIREERPQLHSQDVRHEFAELDQALFRRLILAKLHGKNPDVYGALALYEQRRSSNECIATPVPAGGDTPTGCAPGGTQNADYVLELSHAAANLGMGKLAGELAEEYRKVSSRQRSLAEVGAEAGAGTVSDSGPPELQEKLKISDERFAEAEALWVTGSDHDDEIRRKLGQVVTESRFSLEKELILGLLEQRRQKPATALAHAARAELLATGIESARPAPSPVLLRIRSWLASLEGEAGDPGAALDIYRSIEKDMASQGKFGAASSSIPITDSKLTLLGVPAMPSKEQVPIAEAMLLERKARWGEAAAAYSRALEIGENGNQALYGYARALLKAGGHANRERALSALEKLSGSKTDDFWKTLGSKTLEVEKSAAGK